MKKNPPRICVDRVIPLRLKADAAALAVRENPANVRGVSDQLNATEFDPKSIMLYSFPPQLIQGGKGTANNTDLSAGDKEFIARMYAKA